MANKSTKSINLLDPVYAPNDIWDKLYFWVFNVGKYILVVVQLVVLGVFAARFYVDRQNNDLKEVVNSHVNTLSNDFFSTAEARFRNLHALLDDMRVNNEEQEINSKVIGSLLDGLPSTIRLKQFAFADGRVSMSFISKDFASIRTFERTVQENPAYSEVNVSISKSGEVDNDIDFSISFRVNAGEEVVNES